MPKLVQTHINALYADLTAAKQAVAVAEGEVTRLEDQIRGRDGVVPGEEVPASDVPTDDVANSDDVSAAEVKPKTKKGKK